MTENELSGSYRKCKSPNVEIKKVEDFLSLANLRIPQYQRPYKWQGYNVLQLIDDLITQGDKQSYRLGTIVLHEDGDNDPSGNCSRLMIVDGQQRTLTILLFLKAYYRSHYIGKNDSQYCKTKSKIESIFKCTESFEFTSLISKANIQKNYQTILQEVNKPEFTLNTIEFLLNACEFVVITLSNLSEAFQFFDAQNSRGRDLSPHDLLKAYHLREFSDKEEELKALTVKHWEDTDSRHLSKLFAVYLYRIKRWADGKSARCFTKNDISLFKGINVDTEDSYPFLKALQITHLSVDNYNLHPVSKANRQESDYPFQLDQIIINGRRFFEFVIYYQGFNFLFNNQKLNESFDLSEATKASLKAMDEYEGRNRTGDRYVRNIFNCLLMYYYDKFGNAGLSQAIDKIFVWSYTLRLSYQRLEISSVDNYVLDVNLFESVRKAMRPKDFLHIPLQVLDSKKIKSSRTKIIEARFEKMGYINVS